MQLCPKSEIGFDQNIIVTVGFHTKLMKSLQKYHIVSILISIMKAIDMIKTLTTIIIVYPAW